MTFPRQTYVSSYMAPSCRAGRVSQNIFQLSRANSWQSIHPCLGTKNGLETQKMLQHRSYSLVSCWHLIVRLIAILERPGDLR